MTQSAPVTGYTNKIIAGVYFIIIYAAINTVNIKTMQSSQMEGISWVMKYWHLVAKLNMTSG